MGLEGNKNPLKSFLGGKKDKLIIVLAVVFLAGLFYNLYFGFPGTQQTSTLEKQIADRIQSGLPVTSKEDATKSLAAVSQELENVRGTVSEINKGLEGKEQTTPTGLFSLSEVAVAAVFFVAVVGLVLFIITRKKQTV